MYEKHGVDEYYMANSDHYVNPHEKQVVELVKRALAKGILGSTVLDLCCGTGEVSRALPELSVTGADPYTAKAYEKRTGNPAQCVSFMDMASGLVTGQYDSIICSFALHLCPQSLLPAVLWRLRDATRTLIVISPHKRPDCDGVSGWTLVDEIIVDRVRMRVYLA